MRGRLREIISAGQGPQKTQDRPFGRRRTGNRYRESRAAVARMKYFGTCEIGTQQARDKRDWRCAVGKVLRSAWRKTA